MLRLRSNRRQRRTRATHSRQRAPGLTPIASVSQRRPATPAMRVDASLGVAKQGRRCHASRPAAKQPTSVAGHRRRLGQPAAHHSRHWTQRTDEECYAGSRARRHVHAAPRSVPLAVVSQLDRFAAKGQPADWSNRGLSLPGLPAPSPRLSTEPVALLPARVRQVTAPLLVRDLAREGDQVQVQLFRQSPRRVKRAAGDR